MGLWYFFRSDLRHSLTMIMCGQFNHEIIYHRLLVTGPFMEQFVRGVPDRNVSWNRVTRIYLIYGFTGKQWQKFVIFWLHGTERQSFDLLCFCGTERQNFALRCFHGSDYQRFTLKSVTSLMRLGALVKGSSHFCKLKTNLVSFLGWITQAN